MAAAEHLGVDALLPLSLKNYHRLVEADGFEGERVELLDGLLVRMSPKSEAHEAATEFLLEWLMHHVDLDRYSVGCQRALTIGDSEPEPDLVVRERGTPKPYHPSSAVLVIEVAASSLPVDLAVKAPLYASAGIAEYWVLDLDGRRAIVHRSPEAGGYRERLEVPADGQLVSVALALPALRVTDALDAD
ncbi:Uma2 family endonuclease [Solirubrobacter soli]|uniref:Uma2 family endonuclease n=1 Tax=Solirubrobacter soli TaxID=363832 RepID=UPI0004155638|nr:Uma2 family endonuclease [Solirubrobacter soli]